MTRYSHKSAVSTVDSCLGRSKAPTAFRQGRRLYETIDHETNKIPNWNSKTNRTFSIGHCSTIADSVLFIHLIWYSIPWQSHKTKSVIVSCVVGISNTVCDKPAVIISYLIYELVVVVTHVVQSTRCLHNNNIRRGKCPRRK